MDSCTKGEGTRQRVLRSSISIVNYRGFNNTSISDIIESTGVKKGNLYFHFSSKEELGLAIIRQARDDYMAYLTASIRGQGPLEKVDSIIHAVYDYHKKKKFIGGCIFGNTALEMSDMNKNFASLIREIFNEWISLLSELLHNARDAGELNDTMQPELLARHIVATLEGGIMMSRLSKDKNDLLQCIESIRLLLGMPMITEKGQMR